MNKDYASAEGGGQRGGDTDIEIPSTEPSKKKKNRREEEKEEVGDNKGTVVGAQQIGGSQEDPNTRGQAKLAKLEAITGRSTTTTTTQQPGWIHRPPTGTHTDRGQTKLAKLQASTGGTTTAAHTHQRDVGMHPISGDSAATNNDHRGQAKIAKLEAITGRSVPSRQNHQQQGHLNQQRTHPGGGNAFHTTTSADNRGRAKLAKLEASTGRTNPQQQQRAQGNIGSTTTTLDRGQAKLAKLEANTGRTPRSRQQQQQQQQQHTDGKIGSTSTTLDRGQAKLAKLEANTGRTPRSRQQQQQQQPADGNIGSTTTTLDRGQAKLAKLEANTGRAPRSRQQQQQQQPEDGNIGSTTTTLDRGQAKLAKLEANTGRTPRSRQQQQQQLSVTENNTTATNHNNSSSRRPPPPTSNAVIHDQAMAQPPQQPQQETRTRTFADADLVEAQAVVGESSNGHLNLPQAEPYSNGGGGNLSTEAAAERKTRIILWSCLAFGVLAVVMVGSVVAVTVLGGGGNSSIGTGQAGGGELLPPVAIVPTISPTHSLEGILKSYLPNHTLQAIQTDRQSPQYRAFKWMLSGDPDELWDYIMDQEWRVKQRFALTTFFYATAGDTLTSEDSEFLDDGEIHASALKEQGWLEDQEAHECQWWQKQSLFAENPKGLSYEFGKHKRRCDETDTGRYQNLWLWATDLFGRLDAAPEFFAWLPDLKTLNLDAQGENEDHSYDLNYDLPPGILFGQLPSQVGLLTNLEVLSLNWNLLNLTLPTQIGLMMELRILRLRNDRFSNIPSEIGMLCNLTEIDMSSNEMEGTIPIELFGITALERLNLGYSADVYNNLEGPIVSQIGMLSRLRDLQLSNNYFESLPTEIGLLQELTNLDMSSNALGYDLPSELGLLKNLLHTDISYSEVGGSLPSNFGMLQKLTFLDISGNLLSGDLPSTIGNMTGLKCLNIRENTMTGALPKELGKLVGLKHLELGSNSFSGILPSQIGSLTSLTYLDLSSNDFVSIPSEIGELTGLTFLGLSSNNFNTTPSEVQRLTALTRLDLSNNNFHGMIPPLLASLRTNGSLLSLKLDGNTFSGTLPFELFTLTDLSCEPPLAGCDDTRPVDIYDYISYLLENMPSTTNLRLHWKVTLAGSIPSTIGLLSNLEVLDFGWQHFSGTLPTQLGLLVGLRELRLRRGLSGSLSSMFGLMSNLEILDLSNNEFSGFLPSELGLLTNLESLDASSNQITGIVPTSLGNLEKLTHLALNANNLSGFLGSELGMMTDLGELFLSLNRLSGSIPYQFGLLTALIHLDLSSNMLAGSLPAGFGTLTALSRLDLSSNMLTGSLPYEFRMMTALSGLDLSENRFTGTLDSIDVLLEADYISLREIDVRETNLSGTIPFSLLGLQCCLVSFQCSPTMCGCDDSCPLSMEAYVDYLQDKALELDQPFAKIHVNSPFDGFRYLSPIPSSIGLVSSLDELVLASIGLRGSLPSEMGMLSALREIQLQHNELTGEIPEEIGNLMSLSGALLSDNALSGSLPSQLALIQSLKMLDLENNALTGTVPVELEELRLYNNLTMLKLANNSLSGTIPEGLCSLGVFDSSLNMGMSFDCNAQLCGCCWCPCPERNHSSECETHPFVPSRDDKEWPGQFPTFLANGANAITINIRTDDYPGESSFGWSRRNNESGLWEILESGSPTDSDSLHSYTMEVESDSVYRLEILDSWDGICCHNGLGWLTITSNSASHSNPVSGKVIWKATGDAFEESLFVFVSTDPTGRVHHVEWVSGNDYSEEWPGQFPTPPAGNGSNAITINIRTDDYPEETSFEWSRRDVEEPSLWEIILESGNLTDSHSLHSYTMEVEPDSLYRFLILDSFGDGIANGWITITNSTPSILHFGGSVIWEAPGDLLVSFLDVFVWVDPDGHTHNVEYIQGVGYVSLGEDQVLVVIPENTVGHSASSGGET